MRNLKLTIEYNGTHFYGWQKQDGRRTVQGELEKAFFALTGEEVVVEGSGRTDRGVHALGQVASCQIENKIPLKNIKKAINNLLPDDILIKKVEQASPDFHARFSAKKKTYKYCVCVNGERSALKCDFLANYPYAVDVDLIKKASELLVGKHDFHAFCSANTSVQNFEREIYDIQIKKHGKIFTFYITGNGFLYNMVRIMVGTILDCGRKKITLEAISKALQNGDRGLTGKTMPACGLVLQKVLYD